MALRRTRYTPDPATADVPLSREEIDSMRHQPNLAPSNSREVAHLLARVSATYTSAREEVKGLHRVNAQLQAVKNAAGAPITSDPADVIRFIGPEKAGPLFPAWAQEQIHLLKQQTDELNAETEALRQRGEKVRLAALQLLSIAPEHQPGIQAILAAADISALAPIARPQPLSAPVEPAYAVEAALSPPESDPGALPPFAADVADIADPQAPTVDPNGESRFPGSSYSYATSH